MVGIVFIEFSDICATTATTIKRERYSNLFLCSRQTHFTEKWGKYSSHFIL